MHLLWPTALCQTQGGQTIPNTAALLETLLAINALKGNLREKRETEQECLTSDVVYTPTKCFQHTRSY